MNIALLSTFYPYRGGIAQFGARLYRALEKEHNPSAFTFKRQYPGIMFPGSSQYVLPDDKADKIPAKRVLDSINPMSFGKTAKLIQETNPDLLISQYWMPFFGPSFGAVHRRLKETKRISILHNVIPHEKRFFDEWANSRFLKHNEGFVVLSDAVQDDLLSLVPKAKILRIDHPVYDQFGPRMERDIALGKLGLAPENKYILFFGLIREYKGLDILLEAMESITDDIHLIIAGETYGSFQKYGQIIEEKGIRNRVHLFNHYIADEDVAQFFSAAEVCVLPYKTATQSGITAVSAHFNVPVIATNVGGLKEIIHDGETGIIVPQALPELISKSVNRYINDSLKEVMEKNISAVKRGQSWENFAHKLIEFSNGI